jgi:hypothetical protein
MAGTVAAAVAGTAGTAAETVAAAATAAAAVARAAAAAADHPHIHPCTTISHPPLPHNFIFKFYIFIIRLFCI